MALTRATDKIVGNSDGNLNLSGIVTATSFSGSGANLTGIDATAIKFGSDVKVQANNSGATVTGILTVSGNLSVGGTITYEDVTNVDSVGVVTARTGIKIGPSAGVAGTFFADGSYVTAGIITATTFVGALTGTASGNPTLTSGANNRVVTATGANALTGETGLTYDTQALRLNNTAANPQFHLTSADNGISELKFGDQSDLTRAVILYRSGSAGDALCFNGYNNTERLRIDSAGRLIQRYSAAPYNDRALTLQSPSGQTTTGLAIVNTETNGQSLITFGDHVGQNAGNSTGFINYHHQTNHMGFATNGGTERLRIGSAGQIGIAGANYGTSGQVLTSQGSSSAVQWATPAGGKILQVVNVFKGDGFTTNSTSFTDITGLSISITPSSTSSKIMLSCSMGAAGTRINNGDYGNGIRVMRDIGGGGYSNDNKLNGAADGSRDRITFKGHGWSYNNDHMPGGVGFTGVDDPNTTSAVTYKVQVVCQSSSYAFFLNRNSTNGNNSSIAQARSMTSLIAMEIGG